MKRRGVLLTAAVMIFTLFAAFTAYAGQWRYDSNGYWYQLDDGSYVANEIYTINGARYIFDGEGYMLRNWIENYKTGDWYYCNDDGSMVTNQWIGDYYMGADGRMLRDTWVGNYYVGHDGAWEPGKTRDGATNFRSDWIYGYYNNADKFGFSERHRVDLSINLDGTANLALYDIGGSGLSLYDELNPNGDVFLLHSVDGREFRVTSQISGDDYKLVYNGRDSIRLYWRDTSWYDGEYDGLEFKKISDYTDYGGGGGVG